MDALKAIIFISSDKVKAGVVSLGKEPKMGDTVEYDWSPETLDDIFLGVKKIYGNDVVRILIADGLDCGVLEAAAAKAGIKIEMALTVSAVKELNENPMIGLALKESKEVAEPIEPAKSCLKKFVFLGLGSGLVIALVVGGIFVSKNAVEKRAGSLAGLPVVSPTEMPEPTPTIVLNRSGLKIKVLNGSGISGLAGKAKDYLESLGYEGVETGNAKTYDYAETAIRIKEEKKDYLDLLTRDLGRAYQLAAKTVFLESEEDFDVIVVLGKK